MEKSDLQKDMTHTCAKAFEVELDEGKFYWWCRCGLSKKIPFCDNQHKKTKLLPEVVQVNKAGKYIWCGCGKSSSPPGCSGAEGCSDAED